MTFKRLASLAAISVFTIVSTGPAAIIGATNPSAYTHKDFLADTLDYNHRTIVDAYKKVGHRDPKWDDLAIKLLELESRYFISGQTDMIVSVPDLPTTRDLEAAADAALAAGCDDPMVLDAASVAKRDLRKKTDARSFGVRAAKALLASQYPSERIANSVRRVIGALDSVQDQRQHDEFQKQLLELDFKTIRRTDWGAFDRRAIFGFLDADVEALPLAVQREWIEQLQKQPGDPWLTDMIAGVLHIKIGWAARGGGYANTVTQQGWDSLAGEMDQAEQCFVRADAAQPHLPEAAEQMLTVCLGKSYGADGLRHWFDRATSIQFDDPKAYQDYMYGLLPRWFGNYPKLLAFGLECARTKRYDTSVPAELITVVQKVVNDAGNWACLNAPGVSDALNDTLIAYVGQASNEKAERFFASQLIGFAWQMRRFDMGRQVLEKIKGDVDPHALDVADCVRPRTLSGFYAFTAENAEAAKSAEKFAAGGQFVEASAAYAKLAAGLNDSDPATLWCRGRSQEFIWQDQFEKGGWVDLMPKADLAGWYTQRGTFKADGQAISGNDAKDGAMLWCGLKMGMKYEVEATFEGPAGRDENTSVGQIDAGLLYGFSGVTNENGILAEPQNARVRWLYTYMPPAVQNRGPIGRTFVMHLSMQDGVVDAKCDSCELIKQTQINYFGDPTNQHIAIASTTHEVDQTFRVLAIKARKLN